MDCSAALTESMSALARTLITTLPKLGPALVRGETNLIGEPEIKKIVYVDMDNVLVDFPSGIAKLDPLTQQKLRSTLDLPGFLAKKQLHC